MPNITINDPRASAAYEPQCDDQLANARAQGQAQFDHIVELVKALNAAGDTETQDSDYYRGAIEAAEQAIDESALSVETRGDWYSPSGDGDTAKPAEYRILLCTGGPAVQIRGTLSEHGEPESAHLEVQDWFTPWAEFSPNTTRVPYNKDGNIPHPETILLTYARCFWFGE